MPINAASSNAAASLYANTSKLASGSNVQSPIKDLGIQGVAANEAQYGQPSFADYMAGKISNSIQTMKSGEEMAAKAVTGKADITDVVQAANAAELTLETVVAFRDKIISAYQSIMQMPI